MAGSNPAGKLQRCDQEKDAAWKNVQQGQERVRGILAIDPSHLCGPLQRKRIVSMNASMIRCRTESARVRKSPIKRPRPMAAPTPISTSSRTAAHKARVSTACGQSLRGFLGDSHSFW